MRQAVRKAGAMNRIVGGARYRGMQAGRWMAGLAVLALLAAAGIARADDGGQQTRAVRLSYVQGQVQISQGNQSISSEAAANMPLFEGYQITTGQDGQAEIQFEDGSVARIAPDSGLTLSILRGQGSNGEAEMVLNGGLGYFELQGGDQAGRIDVRFGDAVVTAAGFTVMRVDTDTPPGALAVFSGNAHVVQGDALSLDLHGDESLTLNASNPSQYNLAETVETNSWDQWNSDRDQAMQAEAGTQTQATNNFVNNENPAWNDLNANGNWYNVPGQGYVWSPYMAANAGWDPYGCGQWMWMPPYGYIWVSCQSWGYMPYACGTWNFYSSFGWGWSPGMGGCNPWWRSGYGNGYYGGPNIGTAPSGYRPVIRPPTVLHPPKGRFPRPVIVDRMPKRFSGAPLRQINAPVMIAGHSVEPLKPIVAHNGPAQPVPRTFVGGAERGGGTGGEAHMPRPIVVGREGNPPVSRMDPRTPAHEGYQQPQRYTPPAAGYHTQPSRGYQPPPASAGRGYQPPPAARGYEPPANRGYQPPSGARSEPPRTYSPPARSYSPPPARSEAPPSRGPSGGGFSGGGAFHGGGNPGGGNAGGGGGFHGGGAPAGGGGGASHAGGGGGGHR